MNTETILVLFIAFIFWTTVKVLDNHIYQKFPRKKCEGFLCWNKVFKINLSILWKSQLLVLSMKKAKKGILIIEDNYSRTFYIKILDTSELNLSIHRYHLHCDKVLYDMQQDYPRCKQYYFSSFLQSNSSYSVLCRSTSKAWRSVSASMYNMFKYFFNNMLHYLPKYNLSFEVPTNLTGVAKPFMINQLDDNFSLTVAYVASILCRINISGLPSLMLGIFF